MATVTPKRTRVKLVTYMKYLERGYTMVGAAKACHLSRKALLRHRARTPGYHALEIEAYDAGTAFLEDVARARAVRGKSDVLLVQLLKARDPNRFQPKQRIEAELKGSGPLMAMLSELPEE